MTKKRSSRIDEQETDSNQSDEFESSSDEEEDDTIREDGEAEIPINYGDNKQRSKRSGNTSKTNQDNIEGGQSAS